MARQARSPAIGAAFAAEMARLGYNGQTAARALGVNPQNYSNVKRGSMDVPLPWLVKAAALGANMGAVFAAAAASPAIRPAAVEADAINASQIARILSAALPFLTVADIEAIIAIIRAARARAQGGQGGDGLTIV